MPATRKDVEESAKGGRGGECDASGVGGRRPAGAAAAGGGGVASSGSAYPVASGEERGATSLPMIDSTVHTIYRSPSMGAWMPDSDCGSSNMSRYSLLPPTSAATASIQQMESAAAMMKLAYRNRLHDRIPSGIERRTSTPGGDVTGGSEGPSSWRLSTTAWVGAAAAAAGAEAPAPLRGEPELPRAHGLRLPLADVCEASVARQRAPRDPSSSSDEGLGLDRQPSLTDLRSLDSESGSLAAAMPPAVGRRRPRGLHEQPFSGHRIHQSQSPPHHRLDSLRSSRQMSASTTFHGLPGYTERKGAGNADAPEGPPLRDPRHDLVGMSPPVDYQMWSNKIVELQQMSDSLTQGIANFIRIATSCDPQYKDAMPPLTPKDRYVSTAENHFSTKPLERPSSAVTPRTLFSRTGPVVDAERHFSTPNTGRDNCIIPRVSCTVTPGDVSHSANRYENANNFERGMVSGVPVSPRCGNYLYQEQGSIRGSPRAGVGDTVDSLVTVGTIPSLRGVELDANEVLKRQSAEISGDIGGYIPGVVPRTRRQCTGESGDFEPSGPLVNSETTSSVEMGHCSRNCICKEDLQNATRSNNEVYPNDSATLTLFERTGESVETCTASAVGVSVCETEENISTDVGQHDSSTTNDTPDDSIGWTRSARSETAICSHTSDFVVPDNGINYTFPTSISGIDEMRAMVLKERNANTKESLPNDKCSSECYEREDKIESEKPVADATEVKHEEAEHNLNSSNKNVSGCSSGSSRESSCEPSYDLEQHFLPTPVTRSEVPEAETNIVSKVNNEIQNERNELDSKSINIVRNDDAIENFKNEHIGYTQIGASKPSSSSVMFKMVKEEKAMENICISTCALKTLLSGHGILEDVKEMTMLSDRIPENKEKAAYLNSLRQSTSSVCRVSQNEVQSHLKEDGWDDVLDSVTCTPVAQPAAEKDIYSVSNTSIAVKKGASRAGNGTSAGLCGDSVTVLASQREIATSEDRSRSATPTDDLRGGKDDSGSCATSVSTSLFGSVIRWASATAHSQASAAADSPASYSSSASEIRAPTNSLEDVPACSRRSSVRYDARETLNLVRDLIWKDSTYTTLRPEHDVEVPSAASCQPGAGGAAAGSETKGAAGRPAPAAEEGQQKGAGRGGFRTVWQPKPHRLRHERSSQTCVAVREFPNIPATDSLQRTVKTTNLKGPAKSPTVSPRSGPPALAARLHHKNTSSSVKNAPTVPGGWPAVSARPLPRSSTPAAHAAPAAHGHGAGTGLSRSAGSSPRMAYTREPAGRASSTSGSASTRDVVATRSKDASAADALLADAASLFRAKLDACDRKQGDQRRGQKGRPLSAAARLSGASPAGPPNYLRVLRSGASTGRRQQMQEPENWHQRQQQLQHRQLQLQQRQQQLQQRQLQLQQRQQMQQRQQVMQRQPRGQQTGHWQQRLNQTQVAKPASRRPPSSRAGDAASGLGSAPGSASLRMLQARLRAGGSVHRDVVPLGGAHAIWPEPEGDKDCDLEEEPDTQVADAEPDCPNRDGDAEARPASGDLAQSAAADASPTAAQPSQAEEEHVTPEAKAHDTRNVRGGQCSTDNARICREPLEAMFENPSSPYPEDSSNFNADLVNVEARVSDFSLFSERCNARFVNYLPSSLLTGIDEEDFFRELMLSGQGDVHKNSFDTLSGQGDMRKSSYDTSPQPNCDNETQLRDFVKPLDREDSDTMLSVQSDNVIDPPAEFRTDVKAGGEDQCVSSAQTPKDGCPTRSIPDGLLEVSHSDDAGSKLSCSRTSSNSSILKLGETDTSSNVARTSDLDQLTLTLDMTSESDANHGSSDEEYAMPSHSSCSGISSTESPSILHTERTLANHTKGQNVSSSLCSTQAERNTNSGCDSKNSSPKHIDFRDNDLLTTTTKRAGSNSKDISLSTLPLQSSSLTPVDRKEGHGSLLDSYVKQQAMYQEITNGNARNDSDGSHDHSILDAIAVTAPPITSCVEKICGGTTAKNYITHKPSIQRSPDTELNRANTEGTERDNKTSDSSFCESLSPTSSSEYTDCSHTFEKSVGCPTEDKGSRKDPETKLCDVEKNTSASLPDRKPLSSLLSQEASLTILNTSTENDFTVNSSVKTNTTVQEECRETISCAVETCDSKTGPSLMQDVFTDVPQTDDTSAEDEMVKVVIKTSNNKDNSGNIDTASHDLQDDDSFCDAEDESMSIKSLNNGDVTDASSVSDPFSAAQFFSDGDEGPLSPVGTVASSRLSLEPSITYDDDEYFNKLCATLGRSHVESELQESFNEEFNKTDSVGNDSADINGRIISLGTNKTSYATIPEVSSPETSSTDTHDAQRINVVDVVSSVTSWVTVSTSSFSELPVEDASISSLTASTQSIKENSQEHAENLSDNHKSIIQSIASETCSIYSCQLSVKTTGANSEMENTAEQVENTFDSEKRIGDASADGIYAVRSSALVDEENISSLEVTDTDSNLEIKDDHTDGSSDNDKCILDVAAHETHITPSSELLVEAISSYFAMVGAETILEHVESSSDTAERILNVAKDETLRCSELSDGANISSLVGAATKTNIESSSNNVERIQDTTNAANGINSTAASELPACTRALAGEEMYAIHPSELADEVRLRVVGGTENKVATEVENVVRSSDNTERMQYAARHQPGEANISSAATAGNQTKFENILEHVECSSDVAGRIRHPTAGGRDTSENDATSGKQANEPRTVGSNEGESDEIPLGEASASWETLSEHSCATDEDMADDTRAPPVSSHYQQRRRRHRRESLWRAGRADEEVEPERRLYDLVLASPEVEVHLSEALAHSEAEQPLMPAGPRVSAMGVAGGPDAEALAAALASVALVDADAEAEGATDILYGTRDLHSAAVEAAVACVVDSELRDLSALYVQRMGGCLLVGGQQGPDAGTQDSMPPEDNTCSRMDEDSSSVTTPLSESTTPPASPQGVESTSSSCSLHDSTLALAAAAGAVAACSLDGQRSNTIATLLTVCLFLAAYSSCRIIDPNLHLP